MGCHMWLYKKASSLTREEQLSIIENEMKTNTYNPLEENKEDYIKSMQSLFSDDFEEAEQLVREGKISKDSEEYKIAAQWVDSEFLGNEYEKDCEKQIQKNQKYDLFIKNTEFTVEDFIELHLLINDSYAQIQQYKGEWYIHIVFDTYFRNYRYGDGPIDNYEDMIKYLESSDPNMTHQYGLFDENGKFNYFNPETYEPKKGVTEELKEMLKFLYKDNDILIEFG